MEIVRELGAGGYGCVKLVKDLKTNELFAAKYGKLGSGFA